MKLRLANYLACYFSFCRRCLLVLHLLIDPRSWLPKQTASWLNYFPSYYCCARLQSLCCYRMDIPQKLQLLATFIYLFSKPCARIASHRESSIACHFTVCLLLESPCVYVC